jgi:hypothetical protein
VSVSSQFSVLSSQFSVLSSQFSVLSSQLSVVSWKPWLKVRIVDAIVSHRQNGRLGRTSGESVLTTGNWQLTDTDTDTSYLSAFCTAWLSVLPSTPPAAFSETIFMTAPIWALEVAPACAIASLTS